MKNNFKVLWDLIGDGLNYNEKVYNISNWIIFPKIIYNDQKILEGDR